MIHPVGSLFAQLIALFFGTYLQEDAAIVTGGLLVVKGQLPLILVALTLLGGVISGDLLIYGMGAAARRIPWVHKKLVGPRVLSAKDSLEKNLTLSIFLVRFLPSILFPTFLACGLIGISFYQFLITSVISGAIWTSILLTLVIKLGEVVFPAYGYWGWVIMISVSLLIITYKMLKPRWVRLSNNMTIQTDDFIDAEEVITTLPGMPAISASNHRVALSEKIPYGLFYTPIGLQWIWLGLRYRSMTLPTVANPLIEAGGLWGESKSKLMSSVSPDHNEFVGKFTTIKLDKDLSSEVLLERALEKLKEKGLQFPIVAKPDIGWLGIGVRVIKNEKMLLDYINIYPKDLTIIMQKLIPYKGEAGVFFIRRPGEASGKVTSLTIRYFPFIIGDGISTVEELINKDERLRYKSSFYYGQETMHQGLSQEFLKSVPPTDKLIQIAFIGSIRVGGLYINGEKYITQKLNDRINKIACSIPEFYFGRFDIKFKSIDLLQEGLDFEIFEINGAGSEAIHVWDADMPLTKVFSDLFKYQSLLFKISDMNRKRGFKPMGGMEFYKFTKNYKRLMHTYPSSQ
jgi:membrane protein DedA with SNARE-associated domain